MQRTGSSSAAMYRSSSASMASMPSPVAALMQTVPSRSRADATARMVSGDATASSLFHTVTWRPKQTAAHTSQGPPRFARLQLCALPVKGTLRTGRCARGLSAPAAGDPR